jgi:hypothetical protein
MTTVFFCDAPEWKGDLATTENPSGRHRRLWGTIPGGVKKIDGRATHLLIADPPIARKEAKNGAPGEVTSWRDPSS